MLSVGDGVTCTYLQQITPNARSAMAFLKDRCPAVVVLDKALPDISGLNLLRIIKTQGRTRSTFILFYWMT